MIPKGLQVLISELGRLPGIGPRSAERLALHLFLGGREGATRLGNTLLHVHEDVSLCPVCGALCEVDPQSGTAKCQICQDPSRREDILCVVEKAVDVLPLDKSGAFRGQYHVLGGKLSPINGVGPEDLRIKELFDRVRNGGVQEVLMALGMDVESDATVYFIARHLSELGVKVSRLAQGLPAGASLEFADGLTLGRAIENRLTVQ